MTSKQSLLSQVGGGDDIEKRFYRQYIACYFQNYEEYWIEQVAPITNRNMRPQLFKSEKELSELKKSLLHCYFAQLNYSVMFHLGIAHGQATKPDSEIEYTGLMQGFSHLLAATDIGFELLYWWRNKRSDWDAILKECQADRNGDKHLFVRLEEKAKGFEKCWRDDKDNDAASLTKFRNYRNKLVHRGVRIVRVVNNISYFPRIEAQDKYGTWGDNIDQRDFAPASGVLWPAWVETTDYLQQQWGKVLLEKSDKYSR